MATRRTPPKSPQHMKIGQLALAAGVSRSTIHHYLNLGLLHEPVRAGLHVHLYDATHLNRVLWIKHLRQTQKLSLKEIRRLLGEPGADGMAARAPETSPGPEAAPPSVQPETERKKRRIIEVATEMFGQRGYDGVRIEDIARELHMGKATFYEYFETKEELFMECIDGLSLALVPWAKWDDIHREPDIFLKFEKRARAFLEAYPGYANIINLARSTLALGREDLWEKGRRAIGLMASPLRRDLEEARRKGQVRDMNVELVSYFLLALGEWMGYRLAMDGRYTTEDAVREFMAFLRHGLSKPSGEG